MTTPTNRQNLELIALRWLLYDRKCAIALRERSPRSLWCGEPDVLGITKARYLIEIEIKRSVQDFRADMKKTSRWGRTLDGSTFLLNKLPKQFYYMVPPELVNKVFPLVPDWAGLMQSTMQKLPIVVKSAPVNKESKRLSIKECCRLVRMVSHWAMSEAESYQSAFQRFQNGSWSWPEPEFEI